MNINTRVCIESYYLNTDAFQQVYIPIENFHGNSNIIYKHETTIELKYIITNTDNYKTLVNELPAATPYACTHVNFQVY